MSAQIADFEPLLFTMPVRERADLASRLLASLPAFMADSDEGVAEALRREEELERDPDAGLSMEQFESGIAALRGR